MAYVMRHTDFAARLVAAGGVEGEETFVDGGADDLVTDDLASDSGDRYEDDIGAGGEAAGDDAADATLPVARAAFEYANLSGAFIFDNKGEKVRIGWIGNGTCASRPQIHLSRTLSLPSRAPLPKLTERIRRT